MDAIVVVGSIIFLALLWAWSNRPEAPKPEEQPQETVVEGLGTIALTILIAIICLAFVFSFQR